MKKFVFSLEKILNFKQQNLDVLISEMQQLQSALIMTEEMIEQTNNTYNEVGQELDEQSKTGVSMQKLISSKNYLHSLIKKSDELMTKKMNIQSAIERKKDEVVQVKGDIRGLEKLKDKQYKEYQKAVQKNLEQTVEDYVVQTTF